MVHEAVAILSSELSPPLSMDYGIKAGRIPSRDIAEQLLTHMFIFPEHSFSMPSHSRFGEGLPADILVLVFDDLVGDYNTLANVGLVSRSWRAISLPCLLRDIDLSSHNIGRLPEHECKTLLSHSVVMSDQSDEFRPISLIPRQRALLRLMADRPDLAIYIKAFTWTLVWIDFEEYELTDVDMRTWEFFGRMRNVTHLDLASIQNDRDGDYCLHQPYIRQNPSKLFPSVTHLRLVGWMHRGLVKAIVNSLDASKLVSLKLDHLQEEGLLPNGELMSWDLSQKNLPRPGIRNYSCEGIDDTLFARQQRGDAGIFPGPMWFPLRLLRQHCLSSLAHLDIRLGSYSSNIDLRNEISMFHDTVGLIRSARDSLKSVYIGLGESPILHCDPEYLRSCPGSRIYIRHTLPRWCIERTSTLLHLLLPLLTYEVFPRLSNVNLEGFRIIRNPPTLGPNGPMDLSLTWQLIHACPFVDEEFTTRPNVDYRSEFLGYNLSLLERDQESLDKLEEIKISLETS